jgi:hypothetical protein
MITLNLKPKQVEVLYDVLDWYKSDIGRSNEMTDEDWEYFNIVEKIQQQIVSSENS